MARGKTRNVEYYCLWGSGRMFEGDWDTDYISIPADTPDDKMDKPVCKTAARIKWEGDNPPVIIGYYAEGGEEEDNS